MMISNVISRIPQHMPSSCAGSPSQEDACRELQMTDDRQAIVEPNLSAEANSFSAQTWVSATFILIFTTLLSKGLGFVRDVLVARYFGASAQVDAFMVAVTLPTLVGGIGFALSTAFIPAYRKALAQGGLVQCRQLAGGAVGVTLAVSGLFVVVIIAFAPSLVGLLAPGLASDTVVLAAKLARWLSPLVLGLNLFYMLGAIYNALEHFKIPAFTDLISNVLVLLSITLLSSVLGIQSLALGMIAGSLLVVTVMAVPIGLRRMLSLPATPWTADVQRLVILAAPVFMIEVLSQAVGLVENFYGAQLGSGNIAALGFAKRLTIITVALLAGNIARAVFPILSKLVLDQSLAGAKDLFVKLCRQYAIAFIPLSIAFMYFREDIVRVVFVRGAFDAEAATKTSAAFLYYSAGLPLVAVLSIFTRACYAFSDTLVPLAGVVLQLVVMAVLNHFITPVLGLIGIALSSSLALVPSLILMGASLTRRFGGIDPGPLLKTATLALLSSVVALVPLVALNWLVGPPPRGIRELAVEVVVFFAVYFGLGWFFIRQEIRTLWAMLRRA